jgi:hypothetical protein
MDFRLLLCSLRLLLSRSAAVIVFEKERVKGFEPSTSTLARGGAGVRSREAGRGCASRGFALHRALHGLAAVGGTRGQSFVGSDDAGELIRRSNCVGARASPRSKARGAPMADGRAYSPTLQNVFRMWLSKVG